MTKKKKMKEVVLNADQVREARDDGIALYGLMDAVASQYVNEGYFSIGALKHCITIVERINGRLTVFIDNNDIENLPF